MTSKPVPIVDLPTRLSLDGPRPSFSRALWRIASADVSSGNVVTLYVDKGYHAMGIAVAGPVPRRED